jgi:hypothetical protein
MADCSELLSPRFLVERLNRQPHRFRHPVSSFGSKLGSFTFDRWPLMPPSFFLAGLACSISCNVRWETAERSTAAASAFRFESAHCSFLLISSQHAFHVVEAMNKGQLAVRRDVHVAYLVGDKARICSEEFLPGSTFVVSPGVSQRRVAIECRAHRET